MMSGRSHSQVTEAQIHDTGYRPRINGYATGCREAFYEDMMRLPYVGGDIETRSRESVQAIVPRGLEQGCSSWRTGESSARQGTAQHPDGHDLSDVLEVEYINRGWVAQPPRSY
ncbi:hypothetical protein LIA77_08493 [Sarocladium implicatum]|nr:hypothetical protein LIA77_08493 [Sarocladium implicatum]